MSSFFRSTDFSALAKYQESLKSFQQYYTPAFLQGLSDIQKKWNAIDLTWKYRDILPQSIWGIPTLPGTAPPNLNKAIPESDKANEKYEEKPDENKNDDEEERESK